VPEQASSHPALALVNPFRSDSQFGFRGLASVGLAFYFIAALRTALKEKSDALPDPRAWLDLVAVGTIADLVPLTDENRVLTALGLRALGKSPRPGIDALLRLARVERGQIDERTVSFKIGPRINAPGRLGDAGPALDLLLCDSVAKASMAAGSIEQSNDARRAEQERVFREAEAMLPRDLGSCVVVAGESWPSGVVGIVAAKLVERTGRQAFVIAIDRVAGIGRGSARSARGVNLYQALHRSASLLIRYGGHAAAAGLTVSVEHIEALQKALSETVQEMVSETHDKCLYVDGELSLSQVTLSAAESLSALAPFGRGNDEPVFGSRRLRVRESRRVGDRSHLKLVLEGEDGTVRTAIGFGMGDRDPGPGAVIDAAFVPIINRFGGRAVVELELRHFEPLP
jgi:single-stranded-DNA-specific exonuclease